MNTQEITLLQNIAEEIVSNGAWCGHMTAIDYMEEYYEPFFFFLSKAGISIKYFEELHDETRKEQSKVKNWLDDKEIEIFDALDIKYFNEFINLCKQAADELNIELEY